jgi:gliotoxin/aspirochlorine biosynthesis aminotransferase
LNDQFSPASPVLSSQIILTAGGCSALDALTQQICDPGDGVLVATPYWSGLDISLAVQSEARIIAVDIPRTCVTDSSCIEYYSRALHAAVKSHPVRALLLCNPSNPTGECYPRETLQALLDFCIREDLHFISDEVYALSVHGGESKSSTATPQGPGAFSSALALNTSYENVHVIYSLSKDFGCSGIRLV